MSLCEQIKIKNEKIAVYELGIEELLSYLLLDKFDRPENQINTSDIFLRIGEVQQAIRDIKQKQFN